jgi:glycosyltransferase involved in cell wall biosynthesis
VSSGRRTTVLVAGTFDPSFARNRVVVSLLRRAAFDVRVVQRDLWGSERHTLVDKPKWRLALRALSVYPRLLWRVSRARRPDVIVILYPGYVDVAIIGMVARLRGVPVLFDTFISLHDTIVGDRALRSPGSPVGRLTRLADRIACGLANLVLVDTPEHRDYFVQATGLPARKFRVLWLGAQEDVFHPVPGIIRVPNRVLFHGTFIPLQGLDTIVHAAELLQAEGIEFRIVGDGQERGQIERLVRELHLGNVKLIGRVPREQVPHEIAAASLCLGIFGTSAKADRVVPNKVYECLAVGAPVLTGDTTAIRSAFDGEVAVVPTGDPTALAGAVRELLNDPLRLQALADKGRARFERDYSEAALGTLLGGYVAEVVAD